MSVYIVRLKNSTSVPHELVGVFACPLPYLAGLVDECTDPSGCEYASIGSAAIMWAGEACSVPSGYDQVTGEPLGFDMAEATFDQRTSALISGLESVGAWKSFA